MRKIEHQIVKSINCNTPFKSGHDQVIIEPDRIIVRLWSTDIITLHKAHPQHKIELFHDGHTSVTTQSRMNAVLRSLFPNSGLYVSRKGGAFYLSMRNEDTPQILFDRKLVLVERDGWWSVEK